MDKVNKKIGLGSLSLLLCIMGLLFSFSFGNKGCYGDVILEFIGIKPWSNGHSGIHYTIFYSLIFFVPSFLIGLKYKANYGLKIGRNLSVVILIMIFICQFGVRIILIL
jgi:hypothetical protein